MRGLVCEDEDGGVSGREEVLERFLFGDISGWLQGGGRRWAVRGTDNESNLRISACEYAAPTTRFGSRADPPGVVTLLFAVSL